MFMYELMTDMARIEQLARSIMMSVTNVCISESCKQQMLDKNTLNTQQDHITLLKMRVISMY